MNSIIDFYPLPDNSWRVAKLSEVTESLTNGMTYDSRSNKGYPITRIETIADGKINQNKVGVTPYNSSMERYKLRKGDILYSHINSVAHIGKTAYCDKDLDILHGMNLLKIVPSNNIKSKFLYYSLNSSIGRRQAYSCAKRAVNQASLSTSEIKKFELLIPTATIQEKIIQILTIWDYSIVKLEKQITQLQCRNMWLANQLLSGKKRFENFIVTSKTHKTKVGELPKDWDIIYISDFLVRVRKSLTPEVDKIYQEIGIRSHTKGIFYKKPVIGKKLGNKSVFWIQPDCFIVNIVFAWEHAVAKTTEMEKGMIASHRFPMYKPKADVLDLDYLLYFFKSKRGKYLLGLASPGGAGRNKTLGQTEFLKLQIPVPCIEEQRRIASVISTADKELLILEKKLERFKEQKKGLMQQLLTGKIRANSKSDNK